MGSSSSQPVSQPPSSAVFTDFLHIDATMDDLAAPQQLIPETPPSATRCKTHSKRKTYSVHKERPRPSLTPSHLISPTKPITTYPFMSPSITSRQAASVSPAPTIRKRKRHSERRNKRENKRSSGPAPSSVEQGTKVAQSRIIPAKQGERPHTSAQSERMLEQEQEQEQEHPSPVPSVPETSCSIGEELTKAYLDGSPPVRHSLEPIDSPGSADPTHTPSAAEKALNTVRELNHTLDLRTNGSFSEDEDELIRRVIRDYKAQRALDVPKLIEIIQWTRDDMDTEEVNHQALSIKLWEDMEDILTRKMEAVKKHVRLQYHGFKCGGWTTAEDQEVKRLYELHPKRWKLISRTMGDRSMHDIHNRWRDYLQPGDQRNTSRWSKEEERLLIHGVTIVLQRLIDEQAENGMPPRDHFTNSDVSWTQVSNEMGNIRSRVQCSVKFTKMQARESPPLLELVIRPREIPESETREENMSPSGRNRRSQHTVQQREETGLAKDRETKKSRKRQRSSHAEDAVATPGRKGEPAQSHAPRSQKRSKWSSRASNPKPHKSKAMVSKEDDADSEPELAH